MLKVTICSSWSNLELVRYVRSRLKLDGFQIVAPTEAWFEYCQDTINEHHRDKRGYESKESMRHKALNIRKYFDYIKESDFIFVINEKNGKEYIGLNTAMEIGVALWLGKPIYFYRQPSKMELREFAKVWE